MGTNYYIQTGCCSSCGRPNPHNHHIGKASFGWRFLWAPLPDDAPGTDVTQAAWFAYLEGKAIVDEYGETITLPAFRKMVEAKKDGQVLTRENIGVGWADPAKYERIGPEGERISLTGGFS